MKIAIAGDEVFGRGVNIGEVASAAAGYPDLLADGFVALENENGSATLSCLNRAHQSRSAGSDDDHVV